jgi:KaiC/GvpD/RAD55 family RecA-like ATPase
MAKPKYNPWADGEKPDLQRAIGVTDLTARNFECFEFDGIWLNMFNKPERNFTALIYGPEKNGKTTFMLQFGKYLTKFGKVLCDSHEEGKSATLKQAYIAQNMDEVKGKFMLLHKELFDHLMYRLSLPGSAKIIIRDSIDYCEMTEKQYKLMTSTYPKKVFILVCWTDKDDITPKSAEARKIKKRVDITIHVKNFKATPVSRFSNTEHGNTPHQFGTPRPSTKLQPTLFQ